LHKKFFDSAQKAAMLTCKIYSLPDLPHPVIISKNPRISGISFNKYQKNYFIFGCWLISARKNLALARKIMDEEGANGQF